MIKKIKALFSKNPGNHGQRSFSGLLKLGFTSGFAILLWLSLLAVLVVKTGGESYDKHQLNREIEGLKAEIQKVETENQKLSELMDYFKDDAYLEKEARLKLNLKKEGEEVVVFPWAKEDKTGEAAKNKKTEVYKKRQSHHWRWWEYFFE